MNKPSSTAANNLQTRATALNPSAEELVDLIGFEETEFVCQRLGGLDIDFGDKPPKIVIAALGEELAVKVTEALGRGRFYFPRSTKRRAALRDTIVRLRRDNTPVAEIALQAGCTERWVYDVLRSEKRRLANQSGQLSFLPPAD